MLQNEENAAPQKIQNSTAFGGHVHDPAWPKLSNMDFKGGLPRGHLLNLESYSIHKGRTPGKSFSIIQALAQHNKVLRVAFEQSPALGERYGKTTMASQLNLEAPIMIDSYSQIVDSVRYPPAEPYSIDFTRKHFLYRDAVFNTLMGTPLERSMLRMETNPYVRTSRRKNISLLLAIRELYRH